MAGLAASGNMNGRAGGDVVGIRSLSWLKVCKSTIF